MDQPAKCNCGTNLMCYIHFGAAIVSPLIAPAMDQSACTCEFRRVGQFGNVEHLRKRDCPRHGEQAAPAVSPDVPQLRLLVAQLSDLAVDLEKHSNDHIHDELSDNVGAAVVEASPNVPRQLKRTCPACFQTYEIKRGHGCPEGRVNVPETDPGIIASDRGYVIDNQPRAYNTQDILHVKSVPCQGTDMTSNMIQPVPSCHRCGQPCVQGNQGSWMCDCTSTPFDMRTAAPVEASPSRCEVVDDGDRCTLPKGHEIHQFVFGPDEASPSAPMCWHKEINDEGICKTCGAKAAIKLEGMQPRGTEPVDMQSIQNSATSKEAQEVSVEASPSAGAQPDDLRKLVQVFCGVNFDQAPGPELVSSLEYRFARAAASQDVLARTKLEEAEWWHSRHPDFREPCNCLGCQRIAALRDQLSKDKGT